MTIRSVFVLLFFLLLSACSNSPTVVPPTASPPPSPTESIPPTIAPTIESTRVPAASAVALNAPLLTPAPTPRELAFGKSYLDVHYCTDGTTPLKMNIIVPNQFVRDPAPVLIHLKYQSDLIRPLVAKGFVVADVPYREPPTDKLPTGVEDVKCAIRYLRAHAADFHINPNQVGVFGCSRGGHMAAMVGVTDSRAEMDNDFGFENESSRVQAVVMFDGIANFRTNYYAALDELTAVHGINSFDDPMVARLSPITYATQDDPPFLIIASQSDHWQAQAQEMKNALTAQNVPVTYLPAEGATHCNFSEVGPNSKANMLETISTFFQQTLK